MRFAVTEVSPTILEHLLDPNLAPGPHVLVLTPDQYDAAMGDPEAKVLLNGFVVHVENVRFITSDYTRQVDIPVGEMKHIRTMNARSHGKGPSRRFPRVPKRLTK